MRQLNRQIAALMIVSLILQSGALGQLFTGLRAAYADSANWEVVGTPGISVGTVTNKVSTVSTSVYGDIPYVAYTDRGLGNKLVVRKFSESTWAYVGSSGGISAGIADCISLFLYNGTPYVAYYDETLRQIIVKKYNGTTWEALGSSGYVDNSTSNREVSLVVHEGIPYVAYQDSDYKATVQRFNDNAWEVVGQAGFTANRAMTVSMDVYGGTPYVAFQDRSKADKATVMAFNGTGWNPVGHAGFSDASALNTKIKVHNGIPYVAYVDQANSSKATVKMFNGTEWTNVGQAGFSGGNVTYLSLDINNGVPYVAYDDGGNNRKATVKMFNGSAWADVGQSVVSQSQSSYVSLSAGGGMLYVAHRDMWNDYKATIMKYPIYGIESFADQTFSDLEFGYHSGSQETRTITVNRAGAGDLNNLTVGISDADSFAMTQPAVRTLNDTVPTTTFTIWAKAGLAVGTYEATVSVEADNMAARHFKISQTVMPQQAAAPTAAPAGGDILFGETVALTTSTPGAMIYYTTDGSNPTASSNRYTGPIPIEAHTTIRAVALMAGMRGSEVITAAYSAVTARPVAAPAGGEVLKGTTIALTTETPGAAITYCTRTGSDPASECSTYTEPIKITEEMTVQAIARKDGIEESAEMSEHYTILILSPPLNLTARAGDQSVALSWAYSDTGSATYSVYQYEGSLAPADPGLWELVQSDVGDTAYTVTGLTNGTSYSFAVTAHHAGRTSGFSDPATATPTTASSGSGGSSTGGGWAPSDNELEEAAADFGEAFRIAAGKFPADRKPELSVSQVEVPAADPGLWRLTQGYEVVDSTQLLDNTEFTATAELQLHADASRLPQGYEPRLFLFDKQKQEWIDLGGEWQAGYIAAQSDRLGIFAAFLVRNLAIDAEFADIGQHWAAPWIELGASLGLTGGYPDGSFRPQKQVTRLEFISMLLRLTGQELPGADGRRSDADLQFSDWTDMPNWGAEYAISAIEAGIVQGYPDGTFRPQATLTRAEMMVMMQRALHLPEADQVLLDAYRDKDEVPGWAVSAIAALMKAKFVHGGANERIEPLTPATRSEVIKILVEAYLESLRAEA